MSDDFESFRPLTDGAGVVTIGGLTIEDRGDRISIHGDLDIAKSAEGLRNATALRAVMQRVQSALVEIAKATPGGLPAENPALAEPTKVRNPFA